MVNFKEKLKEYTKKGIKKTFSKEKKVSSRRIIAPTKPTTVKLKAPPQVEFRSQSFNNVYNHEKRNLLSWK